MTGEIVEFVDNDDTLSFLEHHGVKGMHWGVRRNKPSGEGTPKSNKKLKIAAGVGAGLLTVLGGAYAAKTLHANRQIRISNLKEQQRRISVAKAVVENRLSAQRASFKTISSKHQGTNRMANNQLKEWYNEFGVSPKDRTYVGR